MRASCACPSVRGVGTFGRQRSAYEALNLQNTLNKSYCPLGERHVCVFAKRGGGKRAKNGGRGNRTRDDEDVEIFNIDSGWNENAFAVAAEVLSEMHGWDVSTPRTRYTEEEEEEEEEDHSDDDDDLYAGMDEDDDVLLTSDDFSDDDDDLVEWNADDNDVVTTENILDSIPRHVLKKLVRAQEEAMEEEEKLDSNNQRRVAARYKVHKRLRIISGTAASVRLMSPQGDQTRPMMEKVRGAVFSMIGSLYGTIGGLPSDTRWLDLFAGTGAVGIEAMSRGVGQGHFVELSDWVVENCLSKNIQNCQLEDRAIIHTMKAEEYLKRAARLPGQATFDFISVCPPYELVSYPELYELLEASNLIGEDTIVLVEYPQRVKKHIIDTLGPLSKVRDRKYGRTLLALYAKVE
ncbi:hypothetical protein M9435_002940 [Picochlorum sp. BPE23]|nr:hypothetical protein M9435_002940 [Picochlorum sp. BPE23]